jgi:hypothetical protein
MTALRKECDAVDAHLVETPPEPVGVELATDIML